MKKILFPLATALMVGCLSLQSVMAKKPQVTNNYDRDYKICTDSVKNIKINPPDKVYRYEETKIYSYKDDFSFSYPNDYHIERKNIQETGSNLLIYDPGSYKFLQCLRSKNIQSDEVLEMGKITIISDARNLQQYENLIKSYPDSYSDFRTEKSANGYKIAKYISHDMNDSSCVVFEHPRNLYLVEVCGFMHFLNAHSRELELDDKPAFDRIISKFCFRQLNSDTLQDCGIWNLKKDDVAKRLDELIKNPNSVQQGDLRLCGPAAFFQIWLKRDPNAVRRYVTELYNTGSSHIGNFKITASESLRSQNFASLKINTKSTDWMMMTALKSTNYPETYNGTDNTWWQRMISSTPRNTIKEWLSATGLYQRVENKQFNPTAATLENQLNLGSSSSEKDVILNIDLRMLYYIKEDTPWWRNISWQPEHYIVLASPILVKGDNISFNYWTSGWEPQHLSVDKAQFKKFYWGGIVAETKK